MAVPGAEPRRGSPGAGGRRASPGESKPGGVGGRRGGGGRPAPPGGAGRQMPGWERRSRGTPAGGGSVWLPPTPLALPGGCRWEKRSPRVPLPGAR